MIEYIKLILKQNIYFTVTEVFKEFRNTLGYPFKTKYFLNKILAGLSFEKICIP